MRKRIFDIIQIGNRDDLPSRIFDFFISVVIISNICVLFLRTFDGFETDPFLSHVELGTFLIFIIEYILRIWTADFLYPEETSGKAVVKFLRSYDGIVDVLTIIPFFAFSGFIAFRLLRVLRILHLFRLNTRLDSIHMIAEVIISKRNEILSSLALLAIVMFASSLCLYSVEHEAQPDVFQNAFSGLWCSVATILTVGYGDIYPVTTIGKVITGFFGIIGICVTAIITGILSAGFVESWNSKREQEEIHYDIAEIGEIVAEPSMIGKSVSEINQSTNMEISLVMRGKAYMIPTSELIIQKDDILIGRFRILRKDKSIKAGKA